MEVMSLKCGTTRLRGLHESGISQLVEEIQEHKVASAACYQADRYGKLLRDARDG